jgi:hypothetical protein
VRRILLVEPDDDRRRILESAVASLAHVESHQRFETARRRLQLRPPFDLLVTNARLGAYNGLHLVHLGGSNLEGPRAVVYSDECDGWLGREVRRAGAFFELGTRLRVSLGGYLMGALPSHDRRDPAAPDRRTRLGGGRRRWDLGLTPHADADDSVDLPVIHPSNA